MLHSGEEFGARYFRRPQRGQVPGVLLAVDQGHAVVAGHADQQAQRHLGAIAHSREHGFAKHRLAQRHKVQAGHEFPVLPKLGAVGQASPVQFGVRLHDGWHDPAAMLSRPRLRSAAGHDLRKVPIKHEFRAGQGEPIAQRLAQRAVESERLRFQHHARIGAPPQHRLSRAVPRENALLVGLQQLIGVELCAGGQQTWGRAAAIPGLGDRRERIPWRKPGQRRGLWRIVLHVWIRQQHDHLAVSSPYACGMKLYNYFRSSASFRVRIALELKGLSYDYVPVHLVKGEHKQPVYQQVAPEMLVPHLEVDGHNLGQSMAIIEYLDETHPEPPLLPPDALGRAQVRALAQAIACEIHPLNNLRVLKYLVKELGVGEEAKNTWYRHWVRSGLEAFEQQLALLPTARFCWGEAPTLADCCLVPQIFNGQRFNVSFDGLSRTMAVFEACMALPAFQRAQPSNSPDFES